VLCWSKEQPGRFFFGPRIALVLRGNLCCSAYGDRQQNNEEKKAAVISQHNSAASTVRVFEFHRDGDGTSKRGSANGARRHNGELCVRFALKEQTKRNEKRRLLNGQAGSGGERGKMQRGGEKR
jgi:hypothetical protein